MKLFEAKKSQRLTEANFDLTGFMTGAEADTIVAMLQKETSKIPNIKNHYLDISRTHLKDGDKYLEHYGGNDVYVQFAREKDPKKWAYGYISNDPAATMFRIFFNRRKGKAEANSWQTPSFTNHKAAGAGEFRGAEGTPEQVVAAIVKFLSAVVKNIDKFPNEK